MCMTILSIEINSLFFYIKIANNLPLCHNLYVWEQEN
jgi:hypothetical protein